MALGIDLAAIARLTSLRGNFFGASARIADARPNASTISLLESVR